MRSLRSVASVLAVGVLGVSGVSCAAPGIKGEVMMVVVTDMSLPKDINKVRVEVVAAGSPIYKGDFTPLVGKSAEMLLPGTLGVLVDNQAPATPITLRVVAWQGANPRVVQEIITTVPEQRQVELRMPIQWLCDGTAVSTLDEDNLPDATSTCATGTTCIAGSCVDNTVNSATLPAYSAKNVFGGGTGDGDGSCFDTTPCFAAPTTVPVSAACTVTVDGAVNLALEVASDGICGPTGCFIPLDAYSTVGWQPVSGEPGTLQLPAALCGATGKIATGAVIGVVSSPVTAACALKGESLPTCGPWSSAGSSTPGPNPNEPVALVTGQNHPVALAVDVTSVYWTNSGTPINSTTPTTPDGSVMGVPIPGGKTFNIVTLQPGARDLALAFDPKGNASTVYWTTAGTQPPQASNADGMVQSWAPSTTVAGGITTQLVKLQAGPQGIALQGNNLFWTAFGVYETALPAATFLTTLDPAPAMGAAEYYPTRIAVDKTNAYWTNEGTISSANGSVSMAAISSPEVISIASGGINPRGLALDLDASGNAKTVYFTNFEAKGSVVMVPITGGEAGNPVTLVPDLGYPDGITLDATNLYWTNRSDGTVMTLPKGSSTTPTVLASGQNASGAITVDATTIYWIDEGDPNLADGAVMKLLKP